MEICNQRIGSELRVQSQDLRQQNGKQTKTVNDNNKIQIVVIKNSTQKIWRMPNSIDIHNHNFY